jgi:hypothetical protein
VTSATVRDHGGGDGKGSRAAGRPAGRRARGDRGQVDAVPADRLGQGGWSSRYRRSSARPTRGGTVGGDYRPLPPVSSF